MPHGAKFKTSSPTVSTTAVCLIISTPSWNSSTRKAKQERKRELTELLATSRENEQSVDAWLDMVQDYYNLQELDRPTLMRLIQK